jgi:aminopeptidase
MAFTPAQEHLRRYAEVLVNFGLNGGEGMRPGAVVWVSAPDCAKPLYAEVCRAVWRSGGHVVHDYQPADLPDLNLNRDFYELASEEQLGFFPSRFMRGLLDEADHIIQIRSSAFPKALQGVAGEKIMRRQEAFKPFVGWQSAKEAEERFSWTIGLYGTEALAAEAGLSAQEYWEQIVAACFLDDPDPVARWREVSRQIDEHKAFLNSLAIERLHVQGEDADLWLTLGERRVWLGGGGRNIPSFEIYTTPDCRYTDGWIRFSEPLYIHGSLIRGVELRFEAGRVVSARAQENEGLLREMVGTDGADRVGEFSLTDARLSRITKFMADTLFDENTGGRFGNTHLAVGLGLRHCYDGDRSTVSEEDWERLGFNYSVVHTDIVSTTDRTVTAVLSDGSERVIYADGQFQHD